VPWEARLITSTPPRAAYGAVIGLWNASDCCQSSAPSDPATPTLIGGSAQMQGSQHARSTKTVLPVTVVWTSSWAPGVPESVRL
jgi:hypothetical protein